VLTVVEEGRDERLLLLRTRAIIVAATLNSTAQLAREATMSAPFPDSSFVISPPAIFVSAICLIGSTRVVTTSSTGALSP